MVGMERRYNDHRVSSIGDIIGSRTIQILRTTASTHRSCWNVRDWVHVRLQTRMQSCLARSVHKKHII
eukprot:scaffold14741_cov135-Cylindrotheca_fusiformis.AAC.7